MHGSIPKHDPDLGTGHSDPAEPQRNQVSDFEFLGLEYNNKLNLHRLDVRHGQIKDYVFGLSVIVLLYMAVVFFVLFHSFLSNPGRFSNIGFAGAIFVAPIASITAVMIAMLVGAFRRYSDKDADDFANGAIGLARGMSGGN